MGLELRDNYEHMFDRIVNLGVDYVLESNLHAMVLGVSGGIDSALVAVLANRICDKLKTSYNHECKLIGAIMPIESNKPEETERGIKVATTYCDEIRIITRLETVYNVLREMINDTDAIITSVYKINNDEQPKDVKIRNGNIKARLRMIQLYHLASKHNGLVLSTDNLTELMLSFWTLHGDVGDLGLIQSLWKTEVYGLANWMVNNGYGGDGALQACIDAVPTDGLGVTESDFDQLGYDCYEDIDSALIDYIEHKVSVPNCLVVKRHRDTKFKRDNPINIPRECIVDGRPWFR